MLYWSYWFVITLSYKFLLLKMHTTTFSFILCNSNHANKIKSYWYNFFPIKQFWLGYIILPSLCVVAISGFHYFSKIYFLPEAEKVLFTHSINGSWFIKLLLLVFFFLQLNNSYWFLGMNLVFISLFLKNFLLPFQVTYMLTYECSLVLISRMFLLGL